MCISKDVADVYKVRSYCPECNRYIEGVVAGRICPHCADGANMPLSVVVENKDGLYRCLACDATGEELGTWCKECAPLLVNPLEVK